MSGSETCVDIETCVHTCVRDMRHSESLSGAESDVEETCSVRTSDPETKRRVAKITQMLGPGASAGISSLFPGLAPPLYELHPATPVAGTGWEMLLPQGTQVKSKRIKVIGKGKQRGARRIRRLRYGHLEAADNDSPGLCRLVDSRFGASHHEWARFSAVCRGVQDPGTRKGGLGGEECFLAFPASSMADGPERPAQAQLGQRLTEQVNSSELGGERARRLSYVSCGSRDRFGGDAGPPGVQALASLETAQREVSGDSSRAHKRPLTASEHAKLRRPGHALVNLQRQVETVVPEGHRTSVAMAIVSRQVAAMYAAMSLSSRPPRAKEVSPAVSSIWWLRRYEDIHDVALKMVTCMSQEGEKDKAQAYADRAAKDIVCFWPVIVQEALPAGTEPIAAGAGAAELAGRLSESQRVLHETPLEEVLGHQKDDAGGSLDDSLDEPRDYPDAVASYAVKAALHEHPVMDYRPAGCGELRRGTLRRWLETAALRFLQTRVATQLFSARGHKGQRNFKAEEYPRVFQETVEEEIQKNLDESPEVKRNQSKFFTEFLRQFGETYAERWEEDASTGGGRLDGVVKEVCKIFPSTSSVIEAVTQETMVKRALGAARDTLFTA
eukprot:Hpha_TRINITY_DN16199_c5_g1::TRINITY_DN16199_c5_g1_i7::g.7361::m.7361